jgi:hypothetical protein
MGLLTSYIAATPEQAAAIDIHAGPTGFAHKPGRQETPSPDGTIEAPRRIEDVLDVAGVEPSVTMATLEAILTGADARDIIHEGSVEPIADGGPDGPWLLALRPQLQAALLSTPPDGWQAVAERWAATDELVGMPVDVAVSFLERLAALARRASEHGQRLYCWVSL